MRNFSIDIVWAKIQIAITAVGGWLGYFVGGMDGLLIALLVFVVLDYVTGLMRAIADRTLSSAIGFKGICRKVLIFALVGVGHVLDAHVVGTGSALRSVVICFYLSNEGIRLHGIRIAILALSRLLYWLAPEITVEFGANIVYNMVSA